MSFSTAKGDSTQNPTASEIVMSKQNYAVVLLLTRGQHKLLQRRLVVNDQRGAP